MSVGIALAVLKILTPVATNMAKSKTKKVREQADELQTAIRILKGYAKIDVSADVTDPGSSLRKRSSKKSSKKSSKS